MQSRYFPYLSEHRWLFGLGVALLILEAYVDSLTPSLYRNIVNKALPSGDMESAISNSWILIVLSIVLGVSQLLSTYAFSRMGEGVSARLRTQLFEAINRSPFGYFTSNSSGEIVSLFNNDLMGASNGDNWKLATITMAIIPIWKASSDRISARSKEAQKQAHSIKSQINHNLRELTSQPAALTVRCFKMERDITTEFENLSTQMKDHQTKHAFWRNLSSRLIYIGTAVLSSLLYAFGGFWLLVDGMDVGTIVALSSRVGRLYAPLIGLTTIREDLSLVFMSFERIWKYLDGSKTIPDKLPKAKVDFSAVRGDLHIDDLWFRYMKNDSAPWAVRELNCLIPARSRVAIIGKNGSAKTTLAYLMSGLLEPTQGIIRIDANDLCTIDEDSLRDIVSILDQEPFFLDDSVQKNFEATRRGAELADIRAACQAVQLDDLIMSWPDGYNEKLGQNAGRLSKGERQRLGMARLIFKRPIPKVLILDEFNSHLDPSGDETVWSALDQHFTETTIVYITHKHAALAHADFVIEMPSGRITNKRVPQDPEAE